MSKEIEKLIEQRQKDWELFMKFAKWTTAFVIVAVTWVVTVVIL
jgi:hypothetical protein